MKLIIFNLTVKMGCSSQIRFLFFVFFGSWGKGSFNRILHSSHLVLTQSLSSCLFDLISILFSWNLRQDQHRPPPPPPTSNSSSSTITTFTHGCRRSVRLSLNQIQFCPVWFHPSPTQNRGIRHAVDSIFIQPAQRFSLSLFLFLSLGQAPTTTCISLFSRLLIFSSSPFSLPPADGFQW